MSLIKKQFWHLFNYIYEKEYQKILTIFTFFLAGLFVAFILIIFLPIWLDWGGEDSLGILVLIPLLIIIFTFFGLVFGVLSSRTNEKKITSAKSDIKDILIITGIMALAIGGIYLYIYIRNISNAIK